MKIKYNAPVTLTFSLIAFAVFGISNYVLPLSGYEFFLSDGTYDFSVTYESDGVPLVSNMTRDVTEDCVLSVDEAASELRDVTVSWSDAFSQVISSLQ